MHRPVLFSFPFSSKARLQYYKNKSLPLIYMYTKLSGSVLVSLFWVSQVRCVQVAAVPTLRGRFVQGPVSKRAPAPPPWRGSTTPPSHFWIVCHQPADEGRGQGGVRQWTYFPQGMQLSCPLFSGLLSVDE